MLTRRHWIPPLGLIYAQLAHGFSWALLVWIGWTLALADWRMDLAWLHTVVLAWVTMAALSVLIHAIPTFTDSEWRAPGFARWMVAVYGAGVAVLIAGFLADMRLLPIGGALTLIAVLAYAATSYATLAGAMRGERVERAIARAFTAPISALVLTVLAGFSLAWLFGGHAVWAWIGALPPVHALLGLIGWIALLIFGVSARTLRPITGDGSRWRWVHIVVGLSMLLGVTIAGIGLGLAFLPVTLAGAALIAIGIVAYTIDAADIVRRATVAHRPPQVLVLCALGWLLAALVCGAGTLAGEPWAAATIAMLAIGWAGQMVNAHVYHIGVRLISTVVRGDDDETRPQALLQPRLSWYSAVVFQAAVAMLVAAIFVGSNGLLARAGLIGFSAWIAMVANLSAAAIRAR